jgi:phage terminase small subunit
MANRHGETGMGFNRTKSALVANDPPLSGPKILMELSDKQRMFAKAVSEGRSYSQAARIAGFADTSEGYGKKLMRQPTIQAAVDHYFRANQASSMVTRKRVMEGFLRGIELAEMQGDAANVIGGWRELGKMCGYYAPETKKIDINVTAKRLISKFETMSDEDLAKMLEETVNEIEGEATRIEDE